MNNATTIRKMSDTVLSCEIRSAWAEVKCDIRHGIQPRAQLSNYVAALEAEKARRA
jgi:hypothetical protein